MIIFKKLRDKNNPFDNNDVELITDEICLPEIFEDFASFLRGCGFQVGQVGELDDE